MAEEKKTYFTWYYGMWMSFPARFILDGLDDIVYSARISTGLFGRTDCVAGNRGSKDSKEVILAAGETGLVKLIELGFIPCDVCKPAFSWGGVEETVEALYGITSEADFRNKEILGYDARRLDWKAVISIIGGLPGRIYLPKGLKKREVKKFAKRLKPHTTTLGYYDHDSPNRFTEYKV